MEVTQDLEELRQLLVQARRDNSRRLLSAEVTRLEAIEAERRAAQPAPKPVQPAGERVYEKKLTEYAWHQSNKFVKIYINLKNVHNAPADIVKCNFTDSSFALRVEGLNKMNYNFALNNLLKPIDPTASKCRVKTDCVLVMLSKTSAQSWSHVTAAESAAEEARAARYATPEKGAGGGGDPAAGIMDLMKKMYDDGDDEMKRTIKKAWAEGQDKQRAEGGGGLGGSGGMGGF